MDEREIDRLYQLPLDEFTPARNDLVKRLRAEGEREAAAAVSRLRKPSVAAWAVNRLARAYPDELAALVRSGERLRDAQDALVRGRGTPKAVREATIARRDAVARMVAHAEEVLVSGGQAVSQATLDRIAETLNATAADPDGRALVERRRLTKELAPPSGIEALLGLGPADAGPAPAAPTSPPAKQVETRPSEPKAADRRAARKRSDRDGGGEQEQPKEQERREEQERRAGARRRARELAREASDAERRAARLARQADESARVAERLTRRAEEMRRDAERDREEADQAQRDAEAARGRADEAARVAGA